MKALLAKETFLAYPDHNKPFHIYFDASDLQLGLAIFQEGKPIAYYSRKLNSAQCNYTVGEKELLSIVETLKKIRTILYGGQNIHVYTDHENNTFANVHTQREMCWRMCLEDYGVQLHYVKGETNHLVDALSLLPLKEHESIESWRQQEPSLVTTDTTDSLQAYYSMAIDDDDLLDCFINLPVSSGVPFVLDYRAIRNAQLGDARLLTIQNKQPEDFVNQIVAPTVQLACYILAPHDLGRSIFLRLYSKTH